MFRKNLLLVLLTFSSLFALAQSPLEFNYQAVARDQKGIPLDKREIKVRFSIRSNAPDGAVEYMEIRELETNPFGMFSVSIGSTGAFFSSGSLADVKWDNGKKFLQVEIDVKGGNDYKNLGATQMVSVPYALFALKTLDGGKTAVDLTAGNGITLNDKTIEFGNATGDSIGQLTNDRFLPLNGKSFQFTNGANRLSINQNFLEIQLDSALMPNDTKNSGGIFMKINPVKNTPDALPFLFSRISTMQNGGSTSPNEVVMWGHNLSGGGNAYISGLPAIGYSIESNFKPSPESRWVESHEYYITPQGQQVRLKSYTINTLSNHVDFYHSTDNLYIKNPRNAQEYFRVSNNGDNNENQQLLLGSFNISASDPDNNVQFLSMKPNAELHFQTNWRFVYLPGMYFQNDGTIHMAGNIVPTADNNSLMGYSGRRISNISALNFYGAKSILKENWQVNENIQPTATLDIEGINGFNQFRLRKTYTPTGSSDPNGNTGDMSWDDNYIYIKTSAGWKRTSLESF